MEIVTYDIYEVALYICYGGKVANFKGTGITTKGGYSRKIFFIKIKPWQKWLADNIGIISYKKYKWARQYVKTLTRKTVPRYGTKYRSR